MILTIASFTLFLLASHLTGICCFLLYFSWRLRRTFTSYDSKATMIFREEYLLLCMCGNNSTRWSPTCAAQVMQRCYGSDMIDYVLRNQPGGIPTSSCKRLLHQLLLGVSYLHSYNVRDRVGGGPATLEQPWPPCFSEHFSGSASSAADSAPRH